LWQLLATITLRKVRNLAKYHARARRDYHREQGEEPDPCDSLSPQDFCQRLAAEAPTPEEAAILNESLQRRLQILPPALRQVALWKLQGYSNEEIAGPNMLNCSLRTVERKIERIRGKWLRVEEHASGADDPERPSSPVLP
jgi:DNA-directed RNA polymerase specialized sigma24 family protein